jgi:hypothetical protein
MKKRPRTERRVRERDARKLARDLERLAAGEPGAARDNPIDVVSSSVIAVRAQSAKCPLCGGAFTIDHEAAEADGIRTVEVTCRSCATPRKLWFRIVPQAN